MTTYEDRQHFYDIHEPVQHISVAVDDFGIEAREAIDEIIADGRELDRDISEAEALSLYVRGLQRLADIKRVA